MTKEEKHWGDEGVTIDQIPEDERETLLQQAGPVGEMARLAWEEHQKGDPERQEPGAVTKEQQRLEELGEAPPAPSPAAPAAPTGAVDERAEAERKASARGLEIRDYGTAGEWRVYDPATNRQVSKSVLDEPVATTG